MSYGNYNKYMVLHETYEHVLFMLTLITKEEPLYNTYHTLENWGEENPTHN